MDLAQIKELLKIVAESDVAEVELEEEGIKLVVRKNAATVMMQPAQMYTPFPMAYPQAPPAYPPAAPLPPLPAQAPVAPVAAPVAPVAEDTTPATNGVVVNAPIVGTFYDSPAPEADAFVSVGDRVRPGDVLCIIEAMKLMNEIECEVAGIILQVLVKNTEPVEYDQPLFVIDPA